jgi:hypothetical protein
MKRILQLAAAVALSLTAAESKAQLANGSIAPDWTFTDLNGTSHNLYTYLNAGKTVFIDVSAAWCGPCWNYHTGAYAGTGGVPALEGLWADHGPAGGTGVSASTTDDVMVFFIEGESGNTTAQLNGTSGTGATYSQGDWVTGTLYPIIDPASAAITTFNNNYNIGYFPTIYMICPDRSITEVGQQTTANLYAEKAACSAAVAALDGEVMPSALLNSNLASCDSVTPTFRIANVGTTTMTSATITYKVDGVTQKVFPWTGSLATYANATITGVKVGSAIPGNHTITCEISNPNGGADATASNNTQDVGFLIYPTVGGAPVSQSFESAGIPASWSIDNGASSSQGWEDATVGFSSGNSMTLNWYAIASGDVDIVILDAQSFAGLTTPTLTFDVSYAQYSSENDRLQVETSTNCGTTWVSKYNKSGATLATHAPVGSSTQYEPASDADWRHETVNLSSLAGMTSVLVRFKGTSAYGNNLYVDNINFANATGVEENEAVSSVHIYPNPAQNNATVNFELVNSDEVTISVVNTIGQVIVTENLGNLSAGNHNYELNATDLSNGLYFLNITVGNNTVTKKVSINK